MRTSNFQLPGANRWAKSLAALVAFVFLVPVVVALSAAGKSDVADAAMKGDKAAVRALIAQKADVNVPQADGATAIQWAAYRSDVEMADMLGSVTPDSRARP